MDHRVVVHRSDLQGCWAIPPFIQTITTGSDTHIAHKLGAMRRAEQERSNG